MQEFQTVLVSEMDADLLDGTSKAKIVRVSPAEGSFAIYCSQKSLMLFNAYYEMAF